MFARLSERMFGEPIPRPHIGRFRVLRRLGFGGMGVVYEGEDAALDRRVAIKLLRGPTHHDWIHEEAKALAMLSHPNVVHVYEVGIHEGMLFIAMEYVDGVTLARWQESEPRSWRELVEVYAQAGRALAAAHRAGLVHRDFKPSNAIIDREGRVRVLDFGLARGFEHATSGGGSSTEARGEQTTRTGAGTPAFMAPEQLLRGPVGPASDQFALSVALYQALTGTLPFPAEIPKRLEAIKRGLGAFAQGDRAIPRWLRHVIRRGLAYDPAHRFPSMDGFLQRLETPPSRRWAWFGALGGAGAFAAVMWQPDGNVPCVEDGLLAEIWDPVVEQDVAEAFDDTDVPEARMIAKAVATSLDTYAERWQDVRQSVCEGAGWPDDERGTGRHERLACLDAQREEMGALSSLLQQPDDHVVSYAQSMVSELHAPEECLRLARSRVEPPPSAHAADVMRQRARIARARFLRSSGRFAEARELLEAVESTARVLAYDPLQAEVMTERGRVEDRAGNRELALERFEEANRVALRSNYAEAEVDAHLLAARVLIHPLEQLERAEAEVRAAQARADALSPNSLREGRIHLVQGFLAEARDDGRTAQLELEQALTTFQRLPATAESDLAESLLLLGNAVSLQGRPDEALALYADALERRRRVLGPRHPLVGQVQSNIATVQMERGEWQAAEQAYLEALEILQDNERYGSYSMEVAQVRIGLAVVATIRGELDRAIELATSADALLEDYSPTHTQRVAAREALCNAYEAAERLELALECHRLLVGLYRAGAKHLELTSLQINIGSDLAALGWDDEANAHYQRVLPELRSALEASDQVPLLGLPLFTYAQVLLRRGDETQALERLEQAHAALMTSPVSPLEPFLVPLVEETAADVAWERARLHQGRGELKPAIKQARAALAYYDARDDSVARELAREITRWLKQQDAR